MSSLGCQGHLSRATNSALATLALALRNIIRLMTATSSAAGSSAPLDPFQNIQLIDLLGHYVMWSINFLGWLVKSLVRSRLQWMQGVMETLPLQVLLSLPMRNLVSALCRCIVRLHAILIREGPSKFPFAGRCAKLLTAIDGCSVSAAGLEHSLGSIGDGGARTRDIEIQLLCTYGVPRELFSQVNQLFSSSLGDYLNQFEAASLGSYVSPPEIDGGQFIPDWRMPQAVTINDGGFFWLAARMDVDNTEQRRRCTRCAAIMRDHEADPTTNPNLEYFLASWWRCPCGGYWEILPPVQLLAEGVAMDPTDFL